MNEIDNTENEENNDVDMSELNQKEEKVNQKMSPEQFRKLVGYVKGKVNHMKHMDKKLAKRRKKNKLSKANRKKNRKK